MREVDGRERATTLQGLDHRFDVAGGHLLPVLPLLPDLLQGLALEYTLALGYGILTCENLDQALVRARLFVH